MGRTIPADSPRKQRKARTREKILAAGKALFERDGYKAATIRGIAAEAGMSTGAVFANFTDKDDLYVAIYQHAPITPEQGLTLLRAMEAMITWHDFEEASPHGHDAGRHEEVQKLRGAVEAIRPFKANFT